MGPRKHIFNPLINIFFYFFYFLKKRLWRNIHGAKKKKCVPPAPWGLDNGSNFFSRRISESYLCKHNPSYTFTNRLLTQKITGRPRSGQCGQLKGESSFLYNAPAQKMRSFHDGGRWAPPGTGQGRGRTNVRLGLYLFFLDSHEKTKTHTGEGKTLSGKNSVRA